jgi:hypothetical protein
MKYVSFFLTPSLSPIILSLPSSSVLMFKSWLMTCINITCSVSRRKIYIYIYIYIIFK